MLYKEPFFRSQRGILGRVLGGWAITPLFTAQSGAPLEVSIGTGATENAQSFGEEYGNSNSASENAVLTAPYTAGNSAHYNVVATGAGTNGNASVGGSGINMFANPAAVLAQFRPLILGARDTSSGGAGVLSRPAYVEPG